MAAQMNKILSEMTEESQYDDFEIEFDMIENYVNTSSSKVQKAYDSMMRSLYINKYSLDCAIDEMEQFLQIVSSK